MTEQKRIAESYRLRAEELRTIADLDRHSQTYEALSKVASDYELMAQSLDAIDRTKRTLARP